MRSNQPSAETVVSADTPCFFAHHFFILAELRSDRFDLSHETPTVLPLTFSATAAGHISQIVGAAWCPMAIILARWRRASGDNFDTIEAA
jgi:hypothetical protein